MTVALDPTLVELEAAAPGTAIDRDAVETVRSAGSGPATVLFVDDRNWGCFFQLEASLRRAGFRTVRVTTGSVSKSASSLCFDRTVRLSSDDELVRLPEILEGENVVDVQAVDSLAVATFGALATMSDSAYQVSWARRRAAVDKLYVSDALHRKGMYTPETVPAYLTSAEYVADVLGLPVVHKARRGSGGSDVVVVRTMEELRELLAGEGGTEGYFFERFVEGKALQFSGVMSRGNALLGVTYETLQRRCDMGPASALRIIDDPAVRGTGELIARTLGIEGLLNIQVIRDADGRDWVHDVNPRVWGSCLAFRSANLDFHEAYVAYLRQSVPEVTPPAPAGSELTVFPAAVESSDVSASAGFALVPFARGVWPYMRWLGPRYAAYESVRHLRRMAHGLLRPSSPETADDAPAPIVPLSVPTPPTHREATRLAS